MKEWKAPEKEAQKMTRDGAVSVNLVTGETTYPSGRMPEQDHSASGETVGAAGKAVDRAELHREQAAAKKKRRKQRRTYREGEAAAGRPSSQLQFSKADWATPELQGAIHKSDKAADRLDAARDAIPNKSPGKPHANPLSRPIQEAGAAIHGKVREVEQENSGVQSGHLGERSFEKAVGYGNRRVQNWRAERKLKSWRDAAKAEQAVVKANADFYYRKAVAENPQLASNPISRLWQKRKLQKQYAAAYRAAGKTAQAGKTAEATAKVAKKTAQESKRTALFVKRHWKGALIVGGIGLLLGCPKCNAVRQVLDGLGHVEGFHEPLVQRFFRAGGLVALLPVVQQVKIIGQHPQAVGDVCPLLVCQATLGRRQSDGIGGRLIRVKPEVTCELLGGLPGVQVEQLGGEVDGISVGSTAEAIIIGVVQLHAGVAVRMERTAHHAMAVGLHAVHLSHLPNGDGGLDLLI